MRLLSTITAGAVGALALMTGYSAPAAAGGAYFVPHFGVAGALANVVVGLATLPFTIAASVAGAGQPAPGYAPGYAPAPGYYPPPAYYPPAPVYYGAPGYYAHPGYHYPHAYGHGYGGYPRYNGHFGSYAAPHAGHNYYRR